MPTTSAVLSELARVKAIFQLRAIASVMGLPTQGIDTRRAETGTGSVHESPVTEGHAPNSTPRSER